MDNTNCNLDRILRITVLGEHDGRFRSEFEMALKAAFVAMPELRKAIS